MANEPVAKSRSENYIASFQGELEASADLVKKCTDLESSLADVIPDTQAETLRELSRAIDAAVLALNKGFLRSVDAQQHVSSAAKQADRFVQLSQTASEEAAAAHSFDEIRDIYLRLQNRASTQRNNSRRAITNMHQYSAFGRNLLRARRQDPGSEELFEGLYKDYAREQGNDDDDIAVVGDLVIEPHCLISLQPLKEPVRTPCGHYFSKDVILSTLERERVRENGSFKCPSPGCASEIKAQDLVRDPLKDLEVSIWLKEQERKRLEDTQAMTAI